MRLKGQDSQTEISVLCFLCLQLRVFPVKTKEQCIPRISLFVVVGEHWDLKRLVAQAEGPQDSSKGGNEDKAPMSEEERLAEEQARRRQEELVRVSTRTQYSNLIIEQNLLNIY